MLYCWSVAYRDNMFMPTDWAFCRSNIDVLKECWIVALEKVVHDLIAYPLNMLAISADGIKASMTIYWVAVRVNSSHSK